MRVVRAVWHGGQVVVDFECNGNGRTVDPSDPRRAVLASLLQVVWNVAPGHQVRLPTSRRCVVTA